MLYKEAFMTKYHILNTKTQTIKVQITYILSW